MKPIYLCLVFALAAACLPVRAQTTALADFTLTHNAAISGHNRERHSDVTAQQCAEACQHSDRSNWCVSFDYNRLKLFCDLSDKRAEDVGGLKTDYAGNPYDYYSLKPDPLEPFARVSNAAIPGHNVEQLRNVQPKDCASACTDPSRSKWCKSFDYFKAQQKCDLSDKRASDVGGLKSDYPGNPYDHYLLVAGEGIANPIPANKHVLFIGIDGLRGDALFCKGCANTPALRALADGGAVHHNVLAGGSQTTYSGPGWASAFTGFWANEHGVTGNDRNLPLLKPHVFDLIKHAYPTATVGVVADWFNLTHNLQPSEADFVVANGPKESQQATDTVLGWLSWKNPPTAIFYYLHNVDIHAASYAPLNALYQSKIVSEDQQIQQVLNALTARPAYAHEEWLIVVASDHGGLNKGHGGQSAGERGTILILNNNYRNPSKLAYCVGDLTATPLLQVDGVTPHILDFLDLPNHTAGHKSAVCGAR